MEFLADCGPEQARKHRGMDIRFWIGKAKAQVHSGA